ncbi:hypothetical protein SAY86_022268 [Trapa natans]|uniref:TmcB/TmcC TPR repeats domain-containing protein n=1 Tax=Trapa natans TaxID=22666 RepID=A0AAN7RKZ5_TRANT|nr:hypothetical protein SAY86_022268 [Trapa natans]
MEKASNNQGLKDVLGEPIEKGPWYNATLAVSHKRRSASCTFPVSGPRGNGILQLKAMKNGDDNWLSYLRPRDWEILIMEALLHVPDNDEKTQTFRMTILDDLPSSPAACSACINDCPRKEVSESKYTRKEDMRACNYFHFINKTRVELLPPPWALFFHSIFLGYFKGWPVIIYLYVLYHHNIHMPVSFAHDGFLGKQMMLRSSSTPILGALLSSHGESPGPGRGHSHSHHHEGTAHTATFGHNHQKLSFHAPTFSCTSSPISPSMVDSNHKGYRRAQSEGNLEELLSSQVNEDDKFCEPYQARKFGLAPPRSGAVLQTIPSFSFYRSGGGYEDEEDDDDEEEEESDVDEGEDEGIEIEDSIIAKPTMAAKEGLLDVGSDIGLLAFQGKEMFLAKGFGVGLGIDMSGGYGGCGHGGGRGPCQVDCGGDDGRENLRMEEHYKRLMEENPNNPLFLRNYAQFLHQTKGEVEMAEEYYSRAILADPRDGDLLCQYAKLTWHLHRDKDRALGYFERAAQASPQDSHVHAAYAGFLWGTEDEDDEDLSSNKSYAMGSST